VPPKPPVPRLPGLLLCLLSAGLVFASGEPLGLGPLAWVAPVPVLVAVVRVENVRWAALYGLVFGLAYFAIELSWIFLFGWMAWTGLTAFMSLYVALGMTFAGIVRRHALAPVLIAGAWTGAELLRDRQPFGGYSWGSIGTTQGNVPGVRWLAGVIGTYGLCFLIVCFAALIACRFAIGRFSIISALLAFGVLALFTWADVAMYGRPPEGRELDLAVIQGDVPRPVQAGQRDAIFANHFELTQDLLDGQHVDVVVWPEDALGIGVSQTAFDQARQLAGEHSTPFLVGRSLLEDDGFLNRVEYIDRFGTHESSYQKRHPVPFGEYVPVPFLRRFVSTLQSEIPSDQVRGTQAEPFDIDGDAIATPICFESVFPRDFLDFARQGAELYVLSTNDASFERSYASEQHLAHTRMRALETRQWVVQAALSGRSASIAPDGEISHETDLFEKTSFTTTVRLRAPHSLYTRTGDLFPSIFAVLTLLATLWTMIRQRRTARTA
jgi:apolipoprotein N-acyltransferase